MIPLYALGVFTSFTLSPDGHGPPAPPAAGAGVAARAVRERSRRDLHALVAIVIAVVKFAGGAWIVMIAVPILVAVLVRVNRTYEAEEDDLLGGLDPREPPPPVGRQTVVLVVDDADARTLRTFRYALTLRPDALHAVHLGDEGSSRDLSDRWAAATGGRHPLELLPVGPDGEGVALAQTVRELTSDGAGVTVLLSEASRAGRLKRFRVRRAQARRTGPLLELEGVSVGVIGDTGRNGSHGVRARGRILPRTRHVAVIPVSRLDRSVVRAVRTALAMKAMDIRAVHAAVDLEAAMHLAEAWGEAGPALGIPLDIEECWDRDIGRVIRAYVAELGGDDVEISVVLPQRTYPTLLQHLLHDRTGRAIARAVALDGHAHVIHVRYRVHKGEPGNGRPSSGGHEAPAAPEASPEPVAAPLDGEIAGRPERQPIPAGRG